MKIIETKYLPVTNTRGSRIKVTSEWGSKTYSYDHAASDPHEAAFNLYLAEQNKLLAEEYPDYHGDWWQLVGSAASLNKRGYTFLIK